MDILKAAIDLMSQRKDKSSITSSDGIADLLTNNSQSNDDKTYGTYQLPEVIITAKKSKPGKNSIKFKTDIANTKSDIDFIENQARPEIYKQIDYMEKYVKSPKFKQRLEKELGAEANSKNTVGNYLAPSKRKDWVKDQVSNKISNSISYLNDIKNKKINIGGFVLNNFGGGEYDPAYKEINIPTGNLKVPEYLQTIPIHELSHASTNKNAYSDFIKENYADKLFIGTDIGSEYIQRPTEVKARLDAIRYLAMKKGIYNPMTQDIDEKGLKKLMSDKEITNDINYKDILSQLKGEYKINGLKWLLNNIAKNKSKKPSQPDQGSLA
jgi:hypothetical protein